ncbi:MAG: hypothetical protein R3E39_01475 [Anaerolineae bacterium]
MTSRRYLQYEHHAQFLCTPLEYPPLLEAWWVKYVTGDGYHAVCPRYLISRCPICGAEHSGKVDTHSITSWNNSSSHQNGQHFGRAKAEQIGCQHFVCVQKFVNLEGLVPVEREAFEIQLHRPFVMPFYLSASPSSSAVIHSLPIHRIEDQQGSVYSLSHQMFVDPIPDIRPNLERKWSPPEYKSFEQITLEDRERLASARFVRRYTAFAVTYYSENPKQLISDYVDRQITPQAAADPDFTAADLRSTASTEEIKHYHPEGFDLLQWAAKGKLHWLDLEQPDLPLKSEPLDQFPYGEFFDLPDHPGSIHYHKGLFWWVGMRSHDKEP